MNLITSESITPQELKIIQWLNINKFTNHLSDFIEREDAYNRLVSGIMGWQWEDEFRAICELQGFECSKPPLGDQYDLLVNNKRVQCKFTIYDDRIDLRSKRGATGCKNRHYDNNDFDILALNSNMTIYIVPISSILVEEDLTRVKKSVKIADLEQFKDNYEVLK